MSSTQRLFVVTTYGSSLDLFHRGLWESLRDEGWDIVGCSGPEPKEALANIRARGFRVIPIPFIRQPAPLRDLWCLFRLWAYLLFHRYDVIHASTPKAMLLGTLAAVLSGHRKVIVTIHGRVYENSIGWKRRIFVLLDRLVCRLAKGVVCVSPSLRDAVLSDKLCSDSHAMVFGSGSCNGIDTTHYDPRAISQEQQDRFMDQHGLDPEIPTLLFVGRIRQDKGINELVHAFLALQEREVPCQLLLVGPEEPVGVIDPVVTEAMETHRHIVRTGSLEDPRTAYAVSALFVFPTWREGFGNVSAEAQAMELPVIAANTIGAVNTLIPGETGLLVPLRDTDGLTEAIAELLNDPVRAEAMGHAGREWVITHFRPADIQKEWLAYLARI